MQLAEYEERLQFRVYPSGHRALVPRELDLALINLELEQCDQQLARLAEAGTPADIQELQLRLAAGETLSNYQHHRVQQWQAGYDTDRRGWETLRWSLEERQRATLEILDAPAPEGCTIEEHVFILREFSYGERQQLEEKHSVLDPTTGERRVDMNARNRELLGRCVLRHSVGGAETPVEDPVNTLPAKIAEMLITSIWARAEMSPALAQHFRCRS